MNTTTSKFQVKPNFYTSEKECLEGEKKIINTNPRYKFFSQTHFTAGDVDQFSQYRDASNGSLELPLDRPLIDFPTPTQVSWSKYSELDCNSVDNTFKYLFFKFKKGIFLKIKRGEVKVFLPFSNKNFTNEWSSRIHIDPKYGDILNFMKHITTLEGYKFSPNKINKFTDTWYANNCLFRSEYPVFEGDTNVPNTSDMFLTLCNTRKIPDIEFFVNRRDFPLLKTDSTEPYNHIYDSDSTPLLSHNYTKYCPILSMVSATDFADIPIPTGDDWARVCITDGKYFPHSSVRNSKITTIVPWCDRISTAIFRGSSTGVGVSIQNNPRLKLSYLSTISPKDSVGVPYVDAGITKWNLRPRKISGEKYLQTIDVSSLPFNLVNFLTPQQQASYKYIINVQGHVASYRLSRELESGSCILLVESQYKLWYSSLLIPYTHYVPVRSDLSDLFSQIEWCKLHDSECQKISENALLFSKKYLTKDGILDYLQTVLINLKKANGIYLYNQISPRDVSSNKELHYISEIPIHISAESFLGAKKSKEIFSNSNTSITEYIVGDRHVVQKKSASVLHEAFVSIQTNGLQNFVRTYSYYNDFILTESIRGVTLSQYIKSDQFNMENFILILVQISLALHIAQHRCKFVHNDLTPWNIMIHTLDKPKTITYKIEGELKCSVSTDIIPTIIDMGRSHVVYKDRHYGNTNIFSSSTIQDIVTLLVTSISDISNFQLDKTSGSALIILANFLAPTGYCQKSFSQNISVGLGQIKFFFSKAGKYTELVSSDKCELEQKTPLDFVNYIAKNIQLGRKLHIQQRKTANTPLYHTTFSETTFQYPEKVLELLKNPPPYFTEVDLNTLRVVSKEIFSENLKFIQKSDCVDLERYRTVYTEILKFC